MLESPISRDEVRNAVWGCGENKSPGPDGFTFEFFRKFWDTLGSDFCAAVEWFFDHSSFSRGCNSSFIALIPKNHDPKFVNDYRPISLIGSLYKHKKQQAMVFKVDFAKAYDSIRWDFLEDVLRAFGFGSKWCSWIRGCLHSGMASVLLNGSPTSEFQFHCGLKQGDPLAPYLFILIMESLHLSLSRAIEAGIFKGIKIGSSLNISHLFYADDAVFIGEWSIANLSGITHILHCFSLLSGLSINLKKSHLLGVGIRSEDVNAAALYFDVRHENPFVNTRGDDWRFPRIYALEINKDCTVADKLQFSVTSSLRRSVRGGVESSQLALLQTYIEGTLLSNMEDRWWEMTRVAKWSSWRWCGGDGWRRGGVDATVKVVLMLKTDGGWRGGEDDAAGGDVVTMVMMVWWDGDGC
ncbi:RNA-directed DNA polymerase, eukaryota [Tanacetum coccineum]